MTNASPRGNSLCGMYGARSTLRASDAVGCVPRIAIVLVTSLWFSLRSKKFPFAYGIPPAL